MEKLQAARMAREALAMVSSLIGKYGSRLVGTPSCSQTAEDLATEFEDSCDKVERETFSLHPGAFLGWIRILVVLYPAALLLLWLSWPLPSLLLSLGGIAVMVWEFFLYREVVDRFYPQVKGVNVYGILDPRHEVRHTVVFSGHHDSAKVFNFFTWKPHLYVLRIGVGLGGFALLAITSLVYTTMEMVNGGLFGFDFPPVALFVLLLLLTGALPWVAKLWNFAGREGTPGAGDNLISSTMGVQLSRYFKRNSDMGNPLSHTRLVFASFDGEEAGLRGARHFFSTHRSNDQVLGGDVHHFNVDCPYDAKHLFFLTSDINGSVKLSQEMATKCVAIAKSMGYDAFSQPIAFLTGGTDAAEAAKCGFQAVTLMAMPWGNRERASVYHTPDDLPEAIDIQAVEETLSIAIRYIEQVDAQD
jgi:hypothetical protein